MGFNKRKRFGGGYKKKQRMDHVKKSWILDLAPNTAQPVDLYTERAGLPGKLTSMVVKVKCYPKWTHSNGTATNPMGTNIPRSEIARVAVILKTPSDSVQASDMAEFSIPTTLDGKKTWKDEQALLLSDNGQMYKSATDTTPFESTMRLKTARMLNGDDKITLLIYPTYNLDPSSTPFTGYLWTIDFVSFHTINA